MNAPARSPGRYDDRSRGVYEPPDLPRRGQRGRMHIVHGVVDDPTPDAKSKLSRQRVAINRNVDALQAEYAAGRISQDAYRAASTYQRIMRANSGPSGGGQWMEGDRVDVQVAKEAAIIAKLDAGREKVRLLEQTGPVIGWQGERLFQLVLVDGHTLGQAALMLFKDNSKRTVLHVGWLFRQSCEVLADECEWLTQESFA